MKSIKINNQHIFVLEKNEHKLFYNNINGKIALAEKIEDLEPAIFEPAKYVKIDLNEFCYDQ